MIQANESLISSTPTYKEFDPSIIPYQGRVIDNIYHDFDYESGTHEILLSGSVGSAKSILMAHLAVRHCIENNKACVLLGRRALPDLKDTIFRKILDHMEGTFIENVHYTVNASSARIRFSNGSEIISRSWADKHYSKLRSLELSMAIVEELTENDDDDKRAYDEIKMRVGRLPHVKQNIIVSATNPDAPSHWAYKYFITSKAKTRHVYYSVTTDNPFLPPQYIAQLKQDLDPKMARRMIYGEWVEIAGEVIYYAYDKAKNFLECDYQINPLLPIICSWDFNVADNKPISMVLMQHDGKSFHIFDEIIISGARTANTLEELENKPYFSKSLKYIICGDASGKHKDTRNIRSDYDIILQWFQNHQLNYQYMVPLANPPVRARHNMVNAHCLNANGERRLFVYQKAKTVDEGFRLTKLKSGASYVEDDSKPYQHCLTAVGYAIMSIDKFKSWVPNKTQIL